MVAGAAVSPGASSGAASGAGWVAGSAGGVSPGALYVVYGVAMIYYPAALIIGGLLLVALAIGGMRAS